MFGPAYFGATYFGPTYWPPGAEVAEEEVKAGRHKRYILPDGQVFTNELEALAEFERQVRARAAELDAEYRPPTPIRRSIRKRKRSRSIHPPKTPAPLATRPLLEIIERLPEAERARIDLELIDLAERFARQRAEEEALILLLS